MSQTIYAVTYKDTQRKCFIYFNPEMCVDKTFDYAKGSESTNTLIHINISTFLIVILAFVFSAKVYRARFLSLKPRQSSNSTVELKIQPERVKV